jgi:hypothetical protein
VTLTLNWNRFHFHGDQPHPTRAVRFREHFCVALCPQPEATAPNQRGQPDTFHIYRATAPTSLRIPAQSDLTPPHSVLTQHKRRCIPARSELTPLHNVLTQQKRRRIPARSELTPPHRVLTQRKRIRIPTRRGLNPSYSVLTQRKRRRIPARSELNPSHSVPMQRTRTRIPVRSELNQFQSVLIQRRRRQIAADRGLMHGESVQLFWRMSHIHYQKLSAHTAQIVARSSPLLLSGRAGRDARTVR